MGDLDSWRPYVKLIMSGIEYLLVFQRGECSMLVVSLRSRYQVQALARTLKSNDTGKYLPGTYDNQFLLLHSSLPAINIQL